MGCDIHAAVEVRGWYEDNWAFVAEPPTPRNYAFFGALAGVRRESRHPLAEGRGLPSDISEDAAKRCRGDHSDSWCTLKELRENRDEMAAEMRGMGYDPDAGVLDQWIELGTMMDAAHAYYEDWKPDGSQTRFVFNFDS